MVETCAKSDWAVDMKETGLLCVLLKCICGTVPVKTSENVWVITTPHSQALQTPHTANCFYWGCRQLKFAPQSPKPELLPLREGGSVLAQPRALCCRHRAGAAAAPGAPELHHCALLSKGTGPAPHTGAGMRYKPEGTLTCCWVLQRCSLRNVRDDWLNPRKMILNEEQVISQITVKSHFL